MCGARGRQEEGEGDRRWGELRRGEDGGRERKVKAGPGGGEQRAQGPKALSGSTVPTGAVLGPLNLPVHGTVSGFPSCGSGFSLKAAGRLLFSKTFLRHLQVCRSVTSGFLGSNCCEMVTDRKRARLRRMGLGRRTRDAGEVDTSYPDGRRVRSAGRKRPGCRSQCACRCVHSLAGRPRGPGLGECCSLRAHRL